MVFAKTILHIYTDQYPFGFPEFVRGTLFLMNYANKNNMVVKLNIVNHSISEYVMIDNFDAVGYTPMVYYDTRDLSLLTDALYAFKNDTVPIFAVTTNMGIHKNEVDMVSAIQFNNMITYTPFINDAVNARLSSDLINQMVPPSITQPYNVVNMYLADTRLDRAQIQNLSMQIGRSIDLTKNTIVISSSEYIRRTIPEFLGGLRVPLSVPSVPVPVLADSIIDYIIVTRSKKIYTFTEYNAKMKKVTYNVRESTSLTTLVLPELYYITNTFAGVYPEAEFRDGTTQTAAFAYPCGIAEDTSGNVYVADTMNNNIRQIQPTGEVVTLAGATDQTSGSTDGPGASALFFGPTGITVDATGNSYVVDAINGLIRKIASDGTVTTLAGSTAGFQDGQGSAAQFNFLYATNP